MEEKGFVDDEFDSEDTEVQNDTSSWKASTINLSARRRLEDYRDNLEMERLLKDEFDFLEDSA